LYRGSLCVGGGILEWTNAWKAYCEFMPAIFLSWKNCR
jgi:hypothetical protein